MKLHKNARLTSKGRELLIERLEAIAEAEAIRLVNLELAKSPLYIDLVRAKAWNGALPQTMLGGETGTLLQLK